jgi:hypothetical protein
MSDVKFVEGLRLFNKHEKAPDFVIGSMVISLNELVKFCKDNPDLLTDYKGTKQLKLQLQKSKQGNLIAVIDTYKKDDKKDESLPF